MQPLKDYLRIFKGLKWREILILALFFVILWIEIPAVWAFESLMLLN